MIFLFIIFLSTITFWHGQSPGGRYLISCLFIFVPEIVKALKRLNNFKYKKLFLITIFLITILNLPSIEYRNTNIKNYTDNAVNIGIAKSPSDRNINAFPTNNLKFNNIILHKIFFGINYLKMKIKLYKLKVILSKSKIHIR